MSVADVSGTSGAGAAAAADAWEELYEEAPCGYLTTAPDGTIRRANRTFLRWIGRDADDVLDRRRFDELLPPGARIYYESHYAPLLHMQGSVREIAFELVRGDGSRLPVLTNATLKRDASGRPLAVLITVFDASDRRRYEQELLHARLEAEARAAAATALEHVIEGVVLVDEDRRVRLLNPAAEEIFGVAAEDVVGLPLSSVTPDWRAVENRIPLGTAEEPWPRPAVLPLYLRGGTRWLSAAAGLAPEGVVYALRDVTEERRVDTLRDDIVAVASHELRTPLAGIHGAAHTLVSLGDTLDEETRRQLIAMIGDQTARMTRILDQISLTERLDRNEVSAERTTFEIAQAVERVAAAAQLLHSRTIRVTSAEPIEVEGDAALFEQVLVNLLDNAVKYSPAGSDVRVEVGRAPAYARVKVVDVGPGIPATDRNRIFEKFVRLDVQQMGGTGGTGLGLYIARELTKRMHGRLGLLDGHGGSTFFVELPLARGAPRASADAA